MLLELIPCQEHSDPWCVTHVISSVTFVTLLLCGGEDASLGFTLLELMPCQEHSDPWFNVAVTLSLMAAHHTLE
jgi:hypothetical protein